ncbi:hypothetical protein [Dongshaea marina]|uniref:hypothetical protein n=1 Tax=Dongshaea marina TaxID=2047966 RepID=UPI00131F3247|nr:hypothetical protein [Dongshaea marina]
MTKDTVSTHTGLSVQDQLWDIHQPGFRIQDLYFSTSSNQRDVWLSRESQTYCYLVTITQIKPDRLKGRVEVIIPGINYRRSGTEGSPLPEDEGKLVEFRPAEIMEILEPITRN